MFPSEPNVKLIDFFGVVLSPGAKGCMVGKVAFRHPHTIESKRSALMNKRKKIVLTHSWPGRESLR